MVASIRFRLLTHAVDGCLCGHDVGVAKSCLPRNVIPATAGIKSSINIEFWMLDWMPTFVGMTAFAATDPELKCVVKK